MSVRVLKEGFGPLFVRTLLLLIVFMYTIAFNISESSLSENSG